MKNLLNKYKYFICGFVLYILSNQIGLGLHFNILQRLCLGLLILPVELYLLKKLNVL